MKTPSGREPPPPKHKAASDVRRVLTRAPAAGWPADADRHREALRLWSSFRGRRCALSPLAATSAGSGARSLVWPDYHMFFFSLRYCLQASYSFLGHGQSWFDEVPSPTSRASPRCASKEPFACTRMGWQLGAVLRSLFAWVVLQKAPVQLSSTVTMSQCVQQCPFVQGTTSFLRLAR